MCSAKPEYEYITKNFGYPEGIVKQIGLCRFDNLKQHEDKVKRQILLMPTWRNWIAHPTKDSYQIEDISDFRNTTYYKELQALLDSESLYNMLQQEDLTLCFYPHREMQKFLSYFTIKPKYQDRIYLGKQEEKDVQELIQESMLMITDYSSVSMDFAYLKKPLIYYQFDDILYRKGHYAESSYFSYQENGFGKVVTKKEEVLKEIAQIANNHFKMEKQYQKRQEAFFDLQDDQNCKRNLEAILETN